MKTRIRILIIALIAVLMLSFATANAQMEYKCGNDVSVYDSDTKGNITYLYTHYGKPTCVALDVNASVFAIFMTDDIESLTASCSITKIEFFDENNNLIKESKVLKKINKAIKNGETISRFVYGVSEAGDSYVITQTSTDIYVGIIKYFKVYGTYKAYKFMSVDIDAFKDSDKLKY